MAVIDDIKLKAKQSPKRIVYPEGNDPRVIEAACQVLDEGIAYPVLLGAEAEIKSKAAEISASLDGIEILDPSQDDRFENYLKLFREMPKNQALTDEESKQRVSDLLTYGCLMLKADFVDGLVGGAVYTSSAVIRACLKILGAAKGFSTVSSYFMMILPDKSFGENGAFIYADGGMIPQPTSDQLADIAIASANSAKNLIGCEPRVAMLSFSTKGSAKHKMADKVIKAKEIVNEKAPSIIVDGELQLDAAVVPEVAKIKAPDSPVAGRANVLIFPDLNSGNICYKITERLAKAEAYGPLFQGLSKPASDLSRGCKTTDIVNITAIISLEAQRADSE